MAKPSRWPTTRPLRAVRRTAVWNWFHYSKRTGGKRNGRTGARFFVRAEECRWKALWMASGEIDHQAGAFLVGIRVLQGGTGDPVNPAQHTRDEFRGGGRACHVEQVRGRVGGMRIAVLMTADAQRPVKIFPGPGPLGRLDERNE